MPDIALRLEKLTKRFNAFTAVNGLDLEVADGDFVTFLGPSGCGKTTTLSLIAGFFPPTSGAIHLRGKSVENLPSFKRDIGVVFQDYALFPHMTVVQNVAFGLEMRKISAPERARRAAEALELVRLTGLDHRKPDQLSGGQRQRVALARALVIRPTILLLDEPLSNLDLKLREEMRIEIVNLQRQLGITTIFVTHDQGEALVMSNKIAVMNHGRIEQLGRPSEIYERPQTKFVAEFIGSMNFLHADLISAPDHAGRARVRTRQGSEFMAAVSPHLSPGASIFLAVRPERIKLLSARPPEHDALIARGRVRQILYLGSKREVRVDLEGNEQGIVDVPNSGDAVSVEEGGSVFISAPSQCCLVIPAG